MVIWGLLGNVEYDIRTSGMDKLNKVAEQVSTGDIQLKLIWLDYLEIEIESGKEMVIRYEGEKLDFPDYYWLMVGNTDGRFVEKLLEAQGVKPIVPLNEIHVVRSKVLGYERLARAGLPIPRTRAFFRNTNTSGIIKDLGYPFVVKPNGGHGGFGVTLIHNEEEWKQYSEQLVEGETYIAQEYISTSKGKDLRIVLVNGEVLSAITRTASDPNEFRSNTDQGGVIAKVTPEAEVTDMAKRAAALFDIPLITVDFMYTPTGYTIAEVNAFPGTVWDPEEQQKVVHGVMEYWMRRMKK